MPSKLSFILILCLMYLHKTCGAVYENTATYDDLQALPAVGNSIGAYKGLTYNAFVAAGPPLSIGTPSVGGIVPKSPSGSAASDFERRLEDGTPGVSVASPYKNLNLLDFYFGCIAATLEGAVRVAVECTITVAGFVKDSNQEVALASFTFTPPVSPVTSVPMIHAVLPPTFRLPLYNVTFANSNALAALVVDNTHYDLLT